MSQSLQFMGLVSALESPEFRLLEVRGGNNQPKISVESLHGEEYSGLFRIYRKSGEPPHVADTSEVIDALSSYFAQGYEQAICYTERGHITYTRTPKGIRIKSEQPSQEEQGKEQHKVDVKYLLESQRTRSMLTELGILTTEGAIRREQYNKLIQIKNFLNIISEILPELRELSHINIVDGACGKSYLSFVLYYFLHEEWRIDARFTCIDTNKTLIRRCQQIRDSLSYEQMEFLDTAVKDFPSGQRVDMLYSLHGCDTASDEAIAAGVRLNSKIILVVPCCHFELRSQLHRHPLKGLTKYGLLEERFAALLTDALRALALEAAGYDTSALRFVMDDISPKNTLLRAIKRSSSPNPQATQQYLELRRMFGVSPTIERLLPDIFKKSELA
jgi:hypothetical protein